MNEISAIRIWLNLFKQRNGFLPSKLWIDSGQWWKVAKDSCLLQWDGRNKLSMALYVNGVPVFPR